MAEYNPVNMANSQPGRMSILGGSGGLDLGSLLGMISSLGGGALSANAAGNTSSSLNQLLQSLQGSQLGQFSFNGPGGQTSNFAGGASGVDLGSLNPAFNSLVGYGSNAVSGLGGIGTPGAVTSANNAVNGEIRPTGAGFQSGLANAAFGGAQSQIADASRNYGDVYNSSLNALRANAQPGNLLAANQLQDSLFGSGRLGTTGGGNLATAFAKGLGQADAGYQLQAQQMAQSQQQNSLGLAQGLAGIGSGVTSLGENLQQGLFGRANTALGNQISLAGLPGQLQGQQLGLGLQALQGQGALNQQGISNFQTALQAAIAQANAKNATANAQANVASTKAQTPTSGDVWGQVLTGIGSRIADPNSSLNNLLGGLFGGSSFGGGLSGAAGSAAGALDSWNTSGSLSNGMQNIGGNIDWGSLLGGFSGAGGQAATAASGLQDLGNVFGSATQSLSDAQLAQQLGSGSAMKAISNIDTGSPTILGTAGNLAGIYSGIQKGGVTGYAGAANSAAGLVGSSIPGINYAGAVGQALKGDIPGAAISAVSTAVPLVGAGFAISGLLNHAFGGGVSNDRNVAAYTQATGAKNSSIVVGHGGGVQLYSLPKSDGTYQLVSGKTFQDLAGNWYGAVIHPDGDQAGWTQKYNDTVNNLQSAKLPKGYTFDPTTGEVRRG